MRSTKIASSLMVSIQFLVLLPGSSWGDNQADQTGIERPKHLSIGDPAPPIRVRKWVKGTPVLELKKGNVYVIDFWATWCIPCLTAMPHATELQKKLRNKGLIVVGVTSTDSYGNSEEAITKLVERKAEAIGFSIGIDGDSHSPKGYLGVFRGKTVEAYLGGAQVPAIPQAFVIDRDGRIAFIGHPLEIDEAVQKCLEGTWDLKAARTQRLARAEAQKLLVELEKVVKAKDFDKGLPLSRTLVDDLQHHEARVFAGVAGLMAEGDGTLARRAPDLALKAGRRAAELTKSADPGILSALASVYFARGETDQAIRTMARAVAISEGGLKPVLETQLEKYRASREKP
jgi:thiol-disulfide isomerase/thioredoxin